MAPAPLLGLTIVPQRQIQRSKNRVPQFIVRKTLDEKLAAHNRVQIDFTSGDAERRHYLYSPAALQQIARNAIMHRAYESTNAPVRAYWFDDRVETSNPGGPYGNVTAQNFGQLGYADYRNPPLNFRVEPTMIFVKLLPGPN